MTMSSLKRAALAATLLAFTGCGEEAQPSGETDSLAPGPESQGRHDRAELVARAVLPAATFAEGPVSGTLIGGGLVGGFFPAQPVQGISSLVDAHDGTFLAMPDNGYGSLDNSADFNLRIYRIRPNFKTARGGNGDIEVESFIELHDPAHLITFTIVNEFTVDRVLTGADFDIESLRV